MRDIAEPMTFRRKGSPISLTFQGRGGGSATTSSIE